MATINNALNNTSPTSIANATQIFTVSNSDDSGTSSASINISVGGGATSGDPTMQFVVTGANTWTMGIDNSTSDDSFVISKNTSLGTNNYHVIQADGFNRWPSQPSFLEILSGNYTNRTGSGNTFTIGSGTVALTEIFDKGNNFTGNTFTCPTGGRMMLYGSAQLTDCTINTGILIRIFTSNRNYEKTIVRPASNTNISINLSALCDFDAADQSVLQIIGYGEASATDDVVGGTATVVTSFSGYLVG